MLDFVIRSSCIYDSMNYRLQDSFTEGNVAGRVIEEQLSRNILEVA